MMEVILTYKDGRIKNYRIPGGRLEVLNWQLSRFSKEELDEIERFDIYRCWDSK